MQPEGGKCLRLARFRLSDSGSEFRVGSRQVCMCPFSAMISTGRCPCPVSSELLESPASFFHGRPNLPATAKITSSLPLAYQG